MLALFAICTIIGPIVSNGTHGSWHCANWIIIGSCNSSAAASSASIASSPEALNDPIAIFFFSAISKISFNVTNISITPLSIFIYCIIDFDIKKK